MEDAGYTDLAGRLWQSEPGWRYGTMQRSPRSDID